MKAAALMQPAVSTAYICKCNTPLRCITVCNATVSGRGVLRISSCHTGDMDDATLPLKVLLIKQSTLRRVENQKQKKKFNKRNKKNEKTTNEIETYRKAPT